MPTYAATVSELVAWLACTAETADGVQTVLVAWVGLLTLIHIYIERDNKHEENRVPIHHQGRVTSLMVTRVLAVTVG